MTVIQKIARNTVLLNISEVLFYILILVYKKYVGYKILDFDCAIGVYCKRVIDKDFQSAGVDINPIYIKKARENGLEDYCIDVKNLKFNNNSFVFNLLFEVLEHIDELKAVLTEIKRAVSRNILIIIPNYNDFHKLKFHGLTDENKLDNHINFFNKKSLKNYFSNHFKKFKVMKVKSLSIEIISLIKILFYPIQLSYYLNLIDTKIYNRLYAIVEVY